MQHDSGSDGIGVEEARSQEEGHQLMDSTNKKVMLSGPSERRLDLSLQIPPRLVGFGNSKGLLQSRNSFKGGLSPRSFLRGISFKLKAAAPEGERRSLLNPDPTSVPESSDMANSSAEPFWNRCVSLPVTPASNLSPSVSTSTTARKWVEQQKSCKGEVTVKVSRSLSVPRRNVVIVRSMSFATRKEHVQVDCADGQITPVHMEDKDEEIPEEEAVCRICLIELSEGGNTLKTECSCKGALRLTHEECAVKWFSIKGNNKCDICGQEVLNLPVTLLRVQSSVPRAHRRENIRQSSNSQSTSDWKDLVVLVLISTICYFFFLEQLLVGGMKTQALLIAAPFSFTLGIMGSIFAVILASKEHAWTYAALEFVIVAVTLHLFYSLLHLNPVYSILLSSFLGFGIMMTLNSLCLHIYAWRAQVTQTTLV
ncbi:uncharacterized protein LOC122668000 isoform X2 [Telopea speciosissima]|uniref:uncharacterized protein LOC122668000 isoform X2 n=1 Tax=Telopea speciosissima TaxID=54955 RepID=UPI001CC4EC97|nr:uncharacterized protein LOC122668000 isoform X2 [Telopea speciosissima]